MSEKSNRHPMEKICAYEYTVRRGDSFYLIANRLGVPLRDLLAANSSINPARLMVGDVLCIPTEEDDAVQQPAPVPPEPEQQPVPSPVVPPESEPDDFPPDDPDALDRPAQPGDDASDEPDACPNAQRRRVFEGETVTDIQLESDLNLHTLQTANPDADLDHLTPGQVLCVPDENMPCPAVTCITLSAGDTLESLALAYNTSVGALLRANPCLAPGDFTAGACVRLPG